MAGLSCVVRHSFFSTTPNDALGKNICEMSYFCVKIKILTEGVSHLILIIIIIINDNVYGAVIVAMVTARVHPVHLMNAD